LRQSKNHTVIGENRRHIVLIHSSLLWFVIAMLTGLAISLSTEHYGTEIG
jgi:hypothetical protein